MLPCETQFRFLIFYMNDSKIVGSEFMTRSILWQIVTRFVYLEKKQQMGVSATWYDGVKFESIMPRLRQISGRCNF